MKKKCFNDKYGQTESVLSGQKTMFREIYKCPNTWDGIWVSGYIVGKDGYGNIAGTYLVDEDEREIPGSYIKPKYAVGEIIAVAQSYKDAGYLGNWKYEGDIPSNDEEYNPEWRPDFCRYYSQIKGWNSKLLVKSDLMPHQIKITGIKLERLQDISDEDCIKEGIEEHMKNVQYGYTSKIGYCGQYPFGTPRSAFADLSDKLFGKSTWEQNPYVIDYEFKLIK